jgi:sulfur-carrier protein adenylyltransferase/sulfurtransferase
LEGNGFEQVYNMQGGINAWDGLVAKGTPESGVAYFSPATRPEELIALAWHLEDGTWKFYSGLCSLRPDQEADDIYRKLAEAEENHKALLRELFRECSGNKLIDGFPDSMISSGKEAIMEGGIPVGEALTWAGGKQAVQVVEFALSLEAAALDLYIRMERRVGDDPSSKVFLVLAREEKQHLEMLSSLFAVISHESS